MKYSFLNLSVFILCLFWSHAALCEKYEIKINPVNPKGEPQSTICNIEQKTCFLTLPYFVESKPDIREYINAAFRFVQDDFEADFMLKGRRLSLSETVMTHFRIRFDQKLEQKLSLFFPDPGANNQKIAELELIVIPSDL
ncbi:MAG: hypothetical protein H6860_04170 [Rhodospirillales bacterium]|nr:hypothetical protein [Rhodospirillales bacterium]